MLPSHIAGKGDQTPDAAEQHDNHYNILDNQINQNKFSAVN